MSSLLVRDARIVTQDEARRVVEGHVHVEDGRIVSVGPEAPESDVVVRADGRLLLPGLINTHTHLAMTLFRGWGDDLPLEQWLSERIWPAEDRMGPEDVRVGVRLGLLELLAGGTTTFLDMYMHVAAAAEEAERSGIRGFIGWGLADAGRTPKGLAHPALADVEAFLGRWRSHPRIRGAPAPHAVYTCHDETFAKCAELAARYGTVLTTHMHETRHEVYQAQAERGMRPLELLDRAGALNERTVLAHCGWTTKAEVRRIAESGAAVSHNPVSNMKLATGGTMPLPELLEAGVRVGLGTDGAASNNRLDLFEAMKTTALVHKQARWDARVADAQTVLDLATRHGAAALGLGHELGSIEPGRRADLILVDTHRPHMVPLHDPISQVVYAARASDVVLTVVDGRVLYEDGGFATLDAPSILQESQAVARRLVEPTPQG